MVQIGRLKRTLRCSEDGELVVGLLRAACQLSQNQARKLIATGKVYIDGEPCTDWRTPLAPGAVVTVDTDRRAPRRLARFDPDSIRHIDESFLVVNKPPDVVSVPPTKTGEPTLLDQLRTHLKSRPELGEPVPLHRLDRETRGLMLFGLTRGDSDDLRRQVRKHLLERAYYAVVSGTPQDHLLAGQIDVSRSRYGGDRKTQFARTRIEVVRPGPVSLVVCRPHTGRYHQLRIQLADAGHPILGDPLHGPKGRNGRRMPLALQSFSLAVTRPEDGRVVRFEVPLDPALESLLNGGRTP